MSYINYNLIFIVFSFDNVASTMSLGEEIRIWEKKSELITACKDSLKIVSKTMLHIVSFSFVCYKSMTVFNFI